MSSKPLRSLATIVVLHLTAAAADREMRHASNGSSGWNAGREATVSKVRTRTFNVVDDTGREDTAHVYTLYEEMIDLDGPSARTEVGKEYTLSNGNDVSVALTGSP